MESKEATRSRNKNQWRSSGSSVHSLNDLREILSRFTKDKEELSEVALEGEDPVIIKWTETNDIVVEVSAAFKSGIPSESSIRKKTLDSSSQSPVKRLRDLFEEIDSPAVTTEEVATRLGWRNEEALEHLVKLEHRGWVEHKKSGDTTLWWPNNKEKATDSEDLDILPEFIKKGLEQSKEDIEEWVRENQREDESLEEAYERLRGNPSHEEFKKLIGGEAGLDNNLMENIKRKRDEANNGKSNLQNMF